MKLVAPTDYEILAVLLQRGRNTASNLAPILDKKRIYLNTRLSALEGSGLIERIGPNPESGLYEITDAGNQVVEYWRSNGPYSGNHRDILAETENDTTGSG